jgi:hypothetical protein
MRRARFFAGQLLTPFVINFFALGDGAGNPRVAAYHAALPYYRIAAQNRRARIYYYVVAYFGVALYALYGVSLFVKLKAFCAKRYPLVYFNMTAYDTSFAYDHPRAVVNKKAAADFCAGVNVNAR